jgi:tetratricopeptide (TPR) repeat protein
MMRRVRDGVSTARRWRPPCAIALAILAIVVPTRNARSDTAPSVWDVAKDPLERERWALHVRVERLLHPPISEDVFPFELRRDEELRLEAARAMLEQGEAEHSPDVRLRFDLGIVYERLATFLVRDDMHRRAVEVLAPALDLAPDHPAATDALESLVYAYAKLDRPHEELSTWRRYIGRLADDRARVAPMMNMGEAEMRLGRIDDAIGTFRNVLQVCATLSNSSARNSTYVLTLWDLAVALDRAGDPRAAVDTAAKAKELRWKEPAPLGQTRDVTGWDAIRDQRTVFFVPDWERQWYLALGYAAAARDERDTHQAAGLWAAAEEHWATYVGRAAASGADDRWLAIARVRRDRAHAERANAEKRAAKEPPRGKGEASSHGEHRL